MKMDMKKKMKKLLVDVRERRKRKVVWVGVSSVQWQGMLMDQDVTFGPDDGM